MNKSIVSTRGARTSGKNVRKEALKIAELAGAKKARDIIILDLSDLSTIADYFIICSGENAVQIRAIAESIDEYYSQKKVFPLGIEGMDFARWVLIDYGDIVIHIFDDETRAYYELEKFWIDAPKIPCKG